jgi:3-oxoacyl-(acyl-carrier-protein) synthase
VNKRVVITGIGTVNPNGNNVPEFWVHCCKGRSGIRPISAFAVPDTYSQIAGIVDDFEPWLEVADLPLNVDRVTAFALVAAQEALRHAGLDPAALPGDAARFGVYISTAIAQIASMEKEFYLQSAGGRQSVGIGDGLRAHAAQWFQFNTTASVLSKRFGFAGGHATMTTGCTGGLDAMGYALDAIRNGVVDVVLTGSTEAPITHLTVAAFGKIGATSKKRNATPTQASRPFERDRDGFVLAEGCGMLVFESLQHALARNAPILAEVGGFASINNCLHMTDIPQDGQSIARSAELALMDARVNVEQVDFINAHGSATPQNDVAESNAFRYLFGERSTRIPVTSIKSQIGHPLSASNSIEVISAVLSLLHSVIPPTINLEHQDPRCQLDVVGNEARDQPVRCVLKTASGFSGIHSSLVLRKY